MRVSAVGGHDCLVSRTGLIPRICPLLTPIRLELVHGIGEGPQSDDHGAPDQLTDGYVMRNGESAVMPPLNDRAQSNGSKTDGNSIVQ
jgi:hypothetical protein